jgi:hypothetical protein
LLQHEKRTAATSESGQVRPVLLIRGILVDPPVALIGATAHYVTDVPEAAIIELGRCCGCSVGYSLVSNDRSGGLHFNQRIRMAVYELPLPVFLPENTRYSKGHRLDFLRSSQTDFGPLNINRVCHFRCDNSGDIFDAPLIVITGKTR